MNVSQQHILRIKGRRRRVSLEQVMWEALVDIANQRKCSVHEVVTEINQFRDRKSLSAAIRCYIVQCLRISARLSINRSRIGIEKVITGCIERQARDDPALPRIILEALTEAGYEVT